MVATVGIFRCLYLRGLNEGLDGKTDQEKVTKRLRRGWDPVLLNAYLGTNNLPRYQGPHLSTSTFQLF